MVGGLLWAGRNTVPAMAFALSQLTRCMKTPSEKSWQAGLHTLQYAFNRKAEGIIFNEDGNRVPIVYYDSGHKQETGDGKAFYFFVIFHMGGPVYWETRKHELPAFGAGEDEYMTQAHAMKWALGYRHLLAELGYSDMVDGPWKVVGDNAQAEVWAREWATRFRVVKELYVVVGVLQDRNSLEFEYDGMLLPS
jgi:hypothetical protein